MLHNTVNFIRLRKIEINTTSKSDIVWHLPILINQEDFKASITFIVSVAIPVTPKSLKILTEAASLTI